MPLRQIILTLGRRPTLERFVRNSRLTRRVVKRFIAGEELSSAIQHAEDLIQKGFTVSLDYLGEDVSSDEEADNALEEYKKILRAIENSSYYKNEFPENLNISIKLSQLGRELNIEQAKQRMLSLLDSAKESRTFVRIDMESSSTVNATLEIARSIWQENKNFGIVLQSMLKRTSKDVEEVIDLGMRVRLVKGAYLEPPEIAYTKKSEVNMEYIECAKKLLLHGNFPAFATHDSRLIRFVNEFSKQNNIPPQKYEIQFLYGIRRNLQEELLKNGYRVRVYIPYGESWYPYFVRRLAERPANLMFFLRSLFSK